MNLTWYLRFVFGSICTCICTNLFTSLSPFCYICVKIFFRFTDQHEWWNICTALIDIINYKTAKLVYNELTKFLLHVYTMGICMLDGASSSSEILRLFLLTNCKYFNKHTESISPYWYDIPMLIFPLMISWMEGYWLQVSY